MRKTTTLIVIANGSKAKFFYNEGLNKGLLARPELNLEEQTLHASDIQADKPGRSFNRGDTGRHAMEYSSDPQDVKMQLFAKKVVARIEEAVQDSKYDRIVIAASPHMLADLRKAVPPSLHAKVLAEIDKDLTQIHETDLPSHFSEVLVL